MGEYFNVPGKVYIPKSYVMSRKQKTYNTIIPNTNTKTFDSSGVTLYPIIVPKDMVSILKLTENNKG